MTEKKVAIQAALQAGKLLKNKFGNIKHISGKRGNPKDLVTEADLASEKIIINKIKHNFPDHGIFSEEAGNHKGQAKNVWVIDPLDGTTNFTREIPCFSISIALAKNKKVVLGVVYLPITDELYVAEKGKGAFMNNKRINVSKTEKLNKAFITAEWWSRDEQHIKKGLQTFSRLARTSSKIRYISSTVWSLSRVAKGVFDLETCDTSFLDIAAVALIIKEAGGKVTDLNNKEILPFSLGVTRIIAANNSLHPKVIKLLK